MITKGCIVKEKMEKKNQEGNWLTQVHLENGHLKRICVCVVGQWLVGCWVTQSKEPIR